MATVIPIGLTLKTGKSLMKINRINQNEDNSSDNNENENTSESRFAAEVVRLVNIALKNKEGLSPLKATVTVQSAALNRSGK